MINNIPSTVNDMITANAFLKAKLIATQLFIIVCYLANKVLLLLLLVRNSDLHLSNKQCSKTFDRMGLIAMPLKSSHVVALLRQSLALGI